LKALDRNEIFYGRGWPNEVAFPDFTNPNTSDWWQYELTQFHKEMVEFDGLWLDMNEFSNFCNGPCVEKQRVLDTMQNKFFYTPSGRSLEDRSLPIDLKHYNGYTQLDAHNYYGTLQTEATFGWFKDPKQNIERKRPFIIERSSFAGLGKYAGKWLGDNAATYEDMQRSVTGTIMMNIFGIPFSGADICGYSRTSSTANAKLCARWH
jgi:alpha-glucosidase (family GH31 glycosyl hydrolase)